MCSLPRLIVTVKARLDWMNPPESLEEELWRQDINNTVAYIASLKEPDTTEQIKEKLEKLWSKLSDR